MCMHDFELGDTADSPTITPTPPAHCDDVPPEKLSTFEKENDFMSKLPSFFSTPSPSFFACFFFFFSVLPFSFSSFPPFLHSPSELSLSKKSVSYFCYQIQLYIGLGMSILLEFAVLSWRLSFLFQLL